MDGRAEGWTDGWTDGETIFSRTLLAVAGGPTKRNKMMPKYFEDDIMSTKYDVIMNFPIYGRFGAIQ